MEHLKKSTDIKVALFSLKKATKKIQSINKILRNITSLKTQLLDEEDLNCIELEYYRSILVERRKSLEKIISNNLKKFLSYNSVNSLIVGDIKEEDENTIVNIPFGTIRITEAELEQQKMVFPILLKENGKYTGKTQLKILDLLSGIIADYKES